MKLKHQNPLTKNTAQWIAEIKDIKNWLVFLQQLGEEAKQVIQQYTSGLLLLTVNLLNAINAEARALLIGQIRVVNILGITETTGSIYVGSVTSTMTAGISYFIAKFIGKESEWITETPAL